jgi:hypothetical protein
MRVMNDCCTTLGGSLITAWCVLRLRVEEVVSRYGGQLWIYWTCSCGQLTLGSPPDSGVGRGANDSSLGKVTLLQKIRRNRGPRRIPWKNNPSERKWIWDLVLGMLEVRYLIKSIWTPTQNSNPNFLVTYFPVMHINTGWAYPLPLWQLELCWETFYQVSERLWQNAGPFFPQTL